MAILQTLGIASCVGGSGLYCGEGAGLLRAEFAKPQNRLHPLRNQWHIINPDDHGTKEEKLARLNRTISHVTEFWIREKQLFLVVGGDHSCAMGTWGGVLNAMAQPAQFGLIWLDAHMDAHTFATSPSSNVHGMPIAALLGKADRKLARLYPGLSFIKPENLVLIGVRSYEQEEYRLLRRAKVEIVFAERIRNLVYVLNQALDKLSRTCQLIGISIDLDAIDPEDAPGVETPATGGIKANELLAALSSISHHPKIVGLEISEYNPESDINNKTVELMKAMVEAFYCPPKQSAEPRLKLIA